MKNKESRYQHVEHEFGPVYDRNSRVLILGSFPSVKSRQQSFYYGHPQNRFWKILAAVYGVEIPDTIEKKRTLLLQNHIALWDVIESCDIIGSSDSSIKNATVNDVRLITSQTDIHLICCNGDKAYRLFEKYMMAQIDGIRVCKLPSTSPANAAYNLDRLIKEWTSVLRMNI